MDTLYFTFLLEKSNLFWWINYIIYCCTFRWIFTQRNKIVEFCLIENWLSDFNKSEKLYFN